jgi:hypothetical protein
MSLFPEITSKNHEEMIEGILVSYKYFVNTQDIWWYCFDDIIEFTHMNENFADKLFSQLSDIEKETFEDWNYYNDYGVNQSKPRRFVTSEVVRQFIERNNQRNNVLIKSINNLEFKEDAREKYFEDDELANSIEKLHTALHNKDYEEMANQIYDIYHSETTYDILDKFKEGFDKEIEYAVDMIRDKLYEEDIKCILMETDDDIFNKFTKIENKWTIE